MDARERFELTRQYCDELDTVHALIMSDGDDWKPPTVKASGKSDPTANRAIHNVDEWQEQLAELRRREEELTSFIGTTLGVIQGVRDGFGEIYANLLEWRYIDRWTWKQVHEDKGIPKTTGYYLVNVAFDWIDSVGVSRLLKKDYEV